MNAFAKIRFCILICLVSADVQAADTPPPKPPVDEPSEMTSPVAPVARSGGKDATAGDQSPSAYLFQAVDDINRDLLKMNSSGGSFGEYLNSYKAHNSTPFLYIIGIPLGEILNSVYFKQLMGLIWVVFVGIGFSMKLKPGSADPTALAMMVFKVIAGGIVLGALPLIYAAAMTVQGMANTVTTSFREVYSESAKAGGIASRIQAINTNSTTEVPDVRAARASGIRLGLIRREGIFTAFVDSDKVYLDEGVLDFLTCYYNAYGPAVLAQTTSSSKRTFTPLPRVDEADINVIREQLLDTYHATATISGLLPLSAAKPVSISLDWQFRNYKRRAQSTIVVDSLAARINDVTKKITDEIAKTPASAEGSEARKKLLSQYESTTADATANWVDTEIIKHLNRAIEGESALWGVLRSTGTNLKRGALAVVEALKPAAISDKVVGWVTKATGFLRDIFMAPFVTVVVMGLRLILELALLGLVLVLPLWYLPGTARAFTGSIETIITTAVLLPFWQCLQFLMDLIFSLAAYFVVSANTVATVTGVLSISTALIIGACLALAQLLASLILLIKSPDILKRLLNGSGWITKFLGSVAAGFAGAAVVAGGAVMAAAAPAVAGAAAGSGAAASGAGAGSAVAGGGSAGAKATMMQKVRSGLGRAGKDAAHTLADLASNDFDPAAAAGNTYSRMSANYSRVRLSRKKPARIGEEPAAKSTSG